MEEVRFSDRLAVQPLLKNERAHRILSWSLLNWSRASLIYRVQKLRKAYPRSLVV